MNFHFKSNLLLNFNLILNFIGKLINLMLILFYKYQN